MKNLTDINFWKTEGINYMRPRNAPMYNEGVENVNAIVEFVGKDSMRDVGCGVGRLASKFTPEQYVGYDMNEHAVAKAQSLTPGYKFIHWDLNHMPFAGTTLYVDGPWCVCDEDIEELFDLLCTNTNAVVLAESMDPIGYDHLSPGIPAYVRTIETYDSLLKAQGFIRTKSRVRRHEHWKNALFTVARWERT